MNLTVARALGRCWGAIRHALAAGDRRRAGAALAAARPDLDPTARRRLVRDSFRRRGAEAWEERAIRRLDLVDLCRRLTLDGWERLQEAEAAGRGVLLLVGAAGYAVVAARAVEAYAGPLHVVAASDDLASPERVLHACGKVMVGLDRLSERGADIAARLVLAGNVPALTVTVDAVPRERYRLAFAPPIWPSEVAGQPPERAIAALSRLFLEAAAGTLSAADRSRER